MQLHVTRSQRQSPSGEMIFRVAYRFQATKEEQALSQLYPLDQDDLFLVTGKSTNQLPLLAEFSEEAKTVDTAEDRENQRITACTDIATYLKRASSFNGEEDYLFSCDPSYD